MNKMTFVGPGWNHHDASLYTILFLDHISGLILGLRPANERRRYFVTTSLIDWAQT